MSRGQAHGDYFYSNISMLCQVNIKLSSTGGKILTCLKVVKTKGSCVQQCQIFSNGDYIRDKK